MRANFFIDNAFFFKVTTYVKHSCTFVVVEETRSGFFGKSAIAVFLTTNRGDRARIIALFVLRAIAKPSL